MVVNSFPIFVRKVVFTCKYVSDTCVSPLQQQLAVAANGRVSMSTRPDPERSGAAAVEIATRRAVYIIWIHAACIVEF